MYKNCIFRSGPELKVDISAVAHVKRRKVYRCISYSECHHIIEEICKQTKKYTNEKEGNKIT